MAASVLTQHNDAFRSGLNSDEDRLDWTNVNVNRFGKLCTHNVDGFIYAQPLFVPSVEVAGRGICDLVVVATMSNWVYAFDAADETGADSASIWAQHLNGLHPVPSRAFRPGYNDIGGAKPSQIGILSTPVIDAVITPQGSTAGTIYVVAMSFDPMKFVADPEAAFDHWLFALDLSTGRTVQLEGGALNPVRFEGFVAGSGYGANNRVGPAERRDGRILFEGKIGTPDLKDSRPLKITDGHISGSGEQVVFNSMQQLQRPGLLLADGVIYSGFGSHGDHDPYHGWIFAHDAKTLRRKGIFCTTRNGAQAGVWQAGEGLTIDREGYVYAGTGNGDTRAVGDPTSGDALGESLLKLKLDASGLQLVGFSQAFRDPAGGDEDFGASSPILLADNRMVGGGKDGNFYLFDPTKMDARGAGDALLQIFLASSDARSDPGKTHHIHGAPVALDSAHGTLIYVWGEDDFLRCFRYDPASKSFPEQPNKRGQPGVPIAIGSVLASADLSAAPLGQDPAGGMPGAMLSLSRKGAKPQTAIVWAAFPSYADANQKVVGGELRAFAADEFENGRFISLWSSRCNRARDDYGSFAKFCCPTVANGRVYVATFNTPGALAVFGQLSHPGGGYDIGFGGRTDLVFNGTASIENGHVRLVGSPHVYQAGSIFYSQRVDVRSFNTTFVVHLAQSDADGFTFTIQGRSPHALGGSGMGLGYGPDAASPFDRGFQIERSVTLKFGLIDNATLAPKSLIGVYTDGVTPSGGPTEKELGVSLHSGNAIRVTVEYAGSTMNVLVADTVTKTKSQMAFQIDIPAHTGTQAYVGFTGATGGKTSTQDIISWDFSPLVA